MTGARKIATTAILAIAWTLGSPVAAESAGSVVDWAQLAAPKVVEILTTDEDGDARETKVWIAVLAGDAYIRTGDSRWFANLERDPDATLRSDEREVAVRVEFVKDPEIAERLTPVFREKYGFQARLLGIFGSGGGRNVLRLHPR